MKTRIKGQRGRGWGSRRTGGGLWETKHLRAPWESGEPWQDDLWEGGEESGVLAPTDSPPTPLPAPPSPQDLRCFMVAQAVGSRGGAGGAWVRQG